MAICSNCGNQLPVNAKFCARCGAQQPAPAQPFYQPPVPPAPAYYPPQPAPPPAYGQTPAGPVNPVLSAVKTLAGSVQFLAAAAAFSGVALFSLLAAFQSSNILGRVLNTMNLFGFDDYSLVLFDALKLIQGFIRAASIIQLLPAIAICLGLWMIHTSAKKPYLPAPETLGLRIIKAVVIYKIVCCMVLPVAFLIGGLVLGFQVESVAVFLTALLFALGFAAPLAFYFPVIGTINTICGTVNTAVPSEKVSSFVIVMNYVIAVVGFISSCFSRNGFTIVGALAMAAFLVLISLTLSNYRETMLRLLNPYAPMQPAPQPPYQNY